MKLDKNTKILIIGLGAIGGSEDGKRMREKMRASTARRSLFDKPV